MHPSIILLCAATSLLCVAPRAQSHTAHPIDNPLSSTSQNIPFVGGSVLTWDEARSQFLFPAAFLPTTGGLITGVEIIPTSSNTTPFERFEIRLDHTTNATLSTTFAANQANPLLVFSRSPGTVTWTGGTWNTLALDLPFPYDGTRNLVMDVRKKLDRPNNPTIPTNSHRVLVYPRRADLPPPIWNSGTHGSGAVDSATAVTTYSTQVLIRLRWAPARTLLINSSRDTSGNANRSYFHLGANLTLTTQGSPGEVFFDLIDGGLGAAGVAIPPINGEWWLSRFFLFAIGTIDLAGQGTVSVTIPGDASLVGIRAVFQSLTIGTSSFNWTNVVDAPIAVY